MISQIKQLTLLILSKFSLNIFSLNLLTFNHKELKGIKHISGFPDGEAHPLTEVCPSLMVQLHETHLFLLAFLIGS